MPSVFAYTDYRKFLFDFYSEGKKNGLTYRHIASSAGFKSAGHFTQIIKGQADISLELASRFAAFLRLKPREASYFTTLVLYNQAEDAREKKRHFERLSSFKRSPIKIVDADHYEFYNKWYYAAIRELFDIISFVGDYRSLAALLVPSITPVQAEKAVRLLERLGLVKKDDQGVFHKTDQVISTGTGASSLSINHFAVTTMDLARRAMAQEEREERNISWMTLTVSPDSFRKIQEELREFRRRALEIARSDQAPEQVYQCNFQIFPLSRRVKRGGTA